MSLSLDRICKSLIESNKGFPRFYQEFGKNHQSWPIFSEQDRISVPLMNDMRSRLL